MSARGEVDRLTRENRELRTQLEDALREVEEVSGANGRLAAKAERTDAAEAALITCHEERKAAWRAVGEVNAKLAKQLEAALAAISCDVVVMRRTVVDFIVSNLTASEAAGLLARSLQTELFDAGQPVDLDVKLAMEEQS